MSAMDSEGLGIRTVYRAHLLYRAGYGHVLITPRLDGRQIEGSSVRAAHTRPHNQGQIGSAEGHVGGTVTWRRRHSTSHMTAPVSPCIPGGLILLWVVPCEVMVSGVTEKKSWPMIHPILHLFSQVANAGWRASLGRHADEMK